MRGPAGLAAWADILAATHLAFDVQATYRTPGTFHGTVTRRRFGDLALVDCAASPFLGDRSLAVMGDHPEEIVGFQFVRKGVELVRESRREIALTAGDVVLWDGLQPTQVEVVEPFVKRTLIFPRERVLAVCPRLADLKALPPMDRNGAASLLVRYLNALAVELPGLDPVAKRRRRRRRARAAARRRRAGGPDEPRRPPRGACAPRCAATSKAHLRDPALDPEAIARAHAISVRALHALFEDTGESVAGLVRRERLARCYEDLGSPSGGSVTEIAFRWGFRDAAHFSRVFKREFELTPSEVRQGALEPASGAAARIGNGSALPHQPPADADLASPRDGGSHGGQGGPRHGRGERHRPRLRDPLRARRARGSSSPTSSAPGPAARRPCATIRGRRAARPRSSPCDVAQAEDGEALVARVVERYGRLDYAHNNAGIGVHKLLADTDDEDFDRVIAVNLRGTFLGMKHQIRQMLAERRRGDRQHVVERGAARRCGCSAPTPRASTASSG